MAKKINKIIVTESELVEKFREWLTDADADELARVAGELFGGKCFTYFDPDANTSQNLYEFEPDENYYGAFGDVE